MTTRTTHRARITYLAVASLDTWLAGHPHHAAARRFTKPLLMPALAASLASDPRATGSPLRTATLAAQLGGWGGDVALLGKGTSPFLAGMASFAAGHAAYLAGLHQVRAARPLWQAPGLRAALATWVVSAPPLAHAAHRRQPELGPPVLAYAALLAVLAGATTHLDPDLPVDARRLLAAGGWTFLVSDTLLALRSFVLDDAPPALESAVMATYTLAQLMLSEGAARSTTSSARHHWTSFPAT